MRYVQMFHILWPDLKGGRGENVSFVLVLCTGTQDPIQKTQQYTTAKQRLVKGVQYVFLLCTGKPRHNQDMFVSY